MKCHERGDYRIRKVGFAWALERRWGNGWDRIGLPMRYATAHALLHELNDWQVQASMEARSVMLGELPRR